MIPPIIFHHTAKDRFLHYVTIDTESNPESLTNPSTEKQKDLGNILVAELLALGVSDAHLDEFGYVYATIPSNSTKKVPVICFCSHLDTSNDCSGFNVKPIVHNNYQGQDLVLPDDNSIVIRMKEHEELKNQIGKDIITASGKTLLGADNKAGIAAIMDAAKILINNPEIKHGKIRILFTPDEEIGRGVHKLDMNKLGADFGYTIDGETAGTLENETFSADGVVITINGVSAHPGYSKGKMENALKIASKIIANLPENYSPEFTEAREGFIHPVTTEGSVEKATIKLIIRDFEDSGLTQHEKLLTEVINNVMVKYPNSSAEIKIREQYRNMGKVLEQNPQVVDYALIALKRAGFDHPKLKAIRGGTDGSRLSFMGLPCPNIFAGEHSFHSKQEWVSVQDIEKSAETIVHLSQVWEEMSPI